MLVQAVQGPSIDTDHSTRATLPTGPRVVSFGTRSTSRPRVSGGASIVTVGGVVYPLPEVRTTTSDTVSPLRTALAVAPEPPPPLSVTAGSWVYPDPAKVTVMAVTVPAEIVATAVAVCPATQRQARSQTTETTTRNRKVIVLGVEPKPCP
jgi:hypothetical protein